MNATNPSGTFKDKSIPTDADDILLAKPKDSQDLRKGWQALAVPTSDGEDDAKGKKKMTGMGGKLDCPQGVGLKNASCLAFKFKDHSGASDELDLEADEDWDVVLPSYEDEYGS